LIFLEDAELVGVGCGGEVAALGPEVDIGLGLGAFGQVDSVEERVARGEDVAFALFDEIDRGPDVAFPNQRLSGDKALPSSQSRLPLDESNR
jgi:hypothetical protein